MKKKMDLTKDSPEIAQEKLESFKKLFPEAISEGKIEVEALRRTIGENVAAADERYTLNWAGKTEAFKALQTSTTATLAPCQAESVDFEKTGNVFIEGENLEVLKVLQKAYYGKIKMIYIDPPYNTGSDSFIYPDRFQETKEEYLKRIEEKDEEGYLLKEGLFQKNSKENGHYHSNWMSMMYPRLFLARNLLKDDGVVFISIDDNEVHNLRLLMNEIFGEENFVAQIIIQSNKRGQTYKEIAKTHEYLLCYTKNYEVDLNEVEKKDNDLIYTDAIGEYNIRELRNRNPKFGKFNRPNLFFPVYAAPAKKDENGFCAISLEKNADFNVEVFPFNSEGKESCWRWSKKLVLKENPADLNKTSLIAKQRRDGGWNIYEKYRKSTCKVKSIWDETQVINEQGTLNLKELSLQNLFDHPKPIELIKKCLLIGGQDEDIVLDFFAGSATTAHAVMRLNSEDDGNRKFICVQLPEKTDSASEAFKAGYATISEIGKERIRRVIKKIKEEMKENRNLFSKDSEGLDFGFKVFKLKDSNFKIWRGDVIDNAEELERQMDLVKDPIKAAALEQNLLWELMLKSGHDLNTQIEENKVGKSKFYVIAGDELAIIVSKADEKVLQAIIKRKPQKVVCLDSIFEGNDQLKTNTVLQMKDAGIEFRTI